MFADYHVHTYYSDDSKTPMEKQVERAISLGLREICFDSFPKAISYPDC